MGVTNSNKVINTDQIACDGSLRVTLALTAAPDIVSHPTDIVLVLDRSGSMTGTPLSNMKLGAKTFIDIIDESTDGAKDGQIGSGSRMAVVSFSNLATADTQLITSVDDLKAAVNALSAGGTTNHADAFSKATELFDPASGNAKVIVMFTDGNTTTGAPPAPVAAAARAQGIIIYCIGLIGSDGLDVDALKVVANAVLDLQQRTKMGLIVVSHYARFYEYIKPTHAHVLMDGRIVVSGGTELIEKIDSEGYEWVEETYHVSAAKEPEKKVELLGSCGAQRGE